MTGKPLGPPSPVGCCSQLWLWKFTPDFYLLPHPHPHTDFAAVPEAFPLTRGSCGGLRGDGAVTQQRSFPGPSRSPGPPARASGSARGQRRLQGQGWSRLAPRLGGASRGKQPSTRELQHRPHAMIFAFFSSCPRSRRDVLPRNRNQRSSLLGSSPNCRRIHAQPNQPPACWEPRLALLGPGPSVRAFVCDWKIALQKVLLAVLLSHFFKVLGAQLCFTPRQTLQPPWELTAHQHRPQPPQALWQGPGSQRQYSYLGFLRSKTALLLLIVKYSSVEPVPSPPVNPGGHSKAQTLCYPFKPA